MEGHLIPPNISYLWIFIWWSFFIVIVVYVISKIPSESQIRFLLKVLSPSESSSRILCELYECNTDGLGSQQPLVFTHWQYRPYVKSPTASPNLTLEIIYYIRIVNLNSLLCLSCLTLSSITATEGQLAFIIYWGIAWWEQSSWAL